MKSVTAIALYTNPEVAPHWGAWIEICGGCWGSA